MTATTRRLFVTGVGTATAVAVALPAFAANPTPTTLNLRAGKTVVKAHHHDTFTATLTSHGKAVVGQTVKLQERKAPTSGHKTTWQEVGTAGVTDANGRCQFTVTPSIAAGHHTQRDQFRAVYAGSTVGTTTYSGSHSQVITVTVKRVSG